MKTGAMIALVAMFLGVLGFFDNASIAKSGDLNISEIAQSEVRIKTNIKKLHKLDNGIQLYSFQYRSDPIQYVGVMADEIAANEKYRGAVVAMGEGHYTVNYEKLGLQLITLETWQKEGQNAFQKNANLILN